MCPLVDYSEMLLTNSVPVEKKTPLPSEGTMEKPRDFLNDLDEQERKEYMNTKQMIPEVKLIQRRGRCTIVKWQDGTETKVVLEEGKPDTGIFGAYCIALAKKCAGSTEKLLRTIDDHDERVIKCRYLAREQEFREKRIKKEAEERKLKWEYDVAAAMYDSRVRDEAIKRLLAKEEKEDI